MAYQAIYVLVAGLLVVAGVVADRARRNAGSILLLAGFGLGLVMTLFGTLLRMVVLMHPDAQESYLLNMVVYALLKYVMPVLQALTQLGPLLAAIGLLLMSLTLGFLRGRNETLQTLLEGGRIDRQV